MVDHCDSSPGSSDSYCTVSRSTGTGASLNMCSTTNGTNCVGRGIPPARLLEEYTYCGSPYVSCVQPTDEHTEDGHHVWKVIGKDGKSNPMIFNGKEWVPVKDGSSGANVGQIKMKGNRYGQAHP